MRLLAALRLTTHSASTSTRIPNAPKTARPSGVPSTAGYSRTPASWTSSSQAEGWRLAATSIRIARSEAIGRPQSSCGSTRAARTPATFEARSVTPRPGLSGPAARTRRLGQHLRRQAAVLAKQADRIGQDRGRFIQQRIRTFLGRLLARRILGHVALAGLQAVIGAAFGEGIERQAQGLALFLATLALGLVAIALGAPFGLVERDVLLLALGAELGHVLRPPAELVVAGHALVVQRLQLGEQWREVAIALVRHRRDLAPLQGVVVGALAKLAGVDRHREGQVGHDPAVLRAAAARQEELRDGQLDVAIAVAF